MTALDEAFERYRAQKFGAYAEFPIDAYTYFAAGWKAAAEEAKEIADRSRRALTNGGAINACKSIGSELERLMHTNAK